VPASIEANLFRAPFHERSFAENTDVSCGKPPESKSDPPPEAGCAGREVHRHKDD
jgi:hypothetical protein